MRRHLLHPGTILGLIALVVALSGSLYAATSLPKASVTTVQIKNGTIALKDLSPAARRALRGQRGPAGRTGLTGAAGAPGAAGAAGTARAFGTVSAAGVVDAARSKNLTVTKLTSAGIGVYCVTPTAAAGVTRATANPVVTPDVTDGAGLHHLAQFLSVGLPDCPAGWVIVTDSFLGGAWTRADISFAIVVP